MDFPFLRQRKKLLLTLAGILFFLTLLLGGRAYFEHLAKKATPLENDDLAFEMSEMLANPATEEFEILPLPGKVSPLTGLPISEESEPRMIAVVIENHPASRLQMRGLNEAGIVFEALAEGGITRFLAIFDTSERKRVGPVRSARSYFVEWAAEFGGAFVHAGGSEDALALLAKSSLLDFDEDGEIVYRDFRHLKPHNLFVSLEAVRAAFEKRSGGKPAENWFDFSDELPASAQTVKQFSVDFSLPSYFVDYIYDAEKDSYHRLLGGSEHASNGDTIRPTNVAIQFTEYWPIDDEGRLDLRTSGEDVAWYFSGGKMWKGVWKKVGNRTRFFDNSGQAVKLQPGQTFIEILDSTKRVKILEQETEVE
ncbi:DUF3048 domain-containing protein [Patescibacteria group bacterium]|nr:DUF3048 domain-containing protein [Patescibacteria group bacterium]